MLLARETDGTRAIMRISTNAIDRARQRIGTEGAMDPYKRKLHKLRRLVAGDVSAIDDDSTSAADSESSQMLYRERLPEFYDVMITDVEEGRSNKIQQGIRTLLFQTMFAFPDVEVQNLTPEMATLHGAYLRHTMGSAPYGCEAKHQMRMALLDYMIGGLGWAKTCLKDGAPTIIAIDTLDMVWDWSASIPQEIQWAACKRRKGLGEWIEHFGTSKGFKEITDHEGRDFDKPIELWFYYSMTGEHCVFRSDIDEHDPVFVGENPYTMPTPAGDTYMLPMEPCYYFAQPGVKFPTGVAEMMLPSQIAIWEAMRRVRDTINNCKPWTDVEEGAYLPEDIANFKDGVLNPVMIRNSNKPPAIQMPGQDVEATVLNWIDRNQKELTEQSGVNPYASGNAIDVDFAAETAAIQNASGLVAGVIAKDNAAFWERVTRKFLAVAHKYDDRPFVCTIDEVPITFDEGDPVSEYLDPMAEIVIQEDTMAFRPRQQRVAEAMQDIEVAAKVAQFFPNAINKAYENYLRARGEKNLKEYMKPPEPMMQPMGAEQSAMADASTAGAA